MRFRSGLIVLAALTMTAGCGSVEPTTQTSMLRGPTPSSGMSIPPLLAIPDATASDQPPAGADGSLPAAPAESAAPAATPTDESLPPSTDDPASEDPLTDVTDEFVPTDQPDQTDTGAIGDPGDTGPSTRSSARSRPASPARATPMSCRTRWRPVRARAMLDDQQVLLYSFSTDQAAADYAASLTSSGVTSDRTGAGPGVRHRADPGPIAKIKAALGAG